MSKSKVPEPVKNLLWGKAAGRCQYDGCSKPLWKDDLTLEEYNIAYVGHIVGDSVGGPRGDEELSEELCKDISNLMLLCDEHHRLVDRKQVAAHPPARLVEMKNRHERRMELLTSIHPDKKSHVLLYGSKIGRVDSFLTYREACLGMIPHWYPADDNPVKLSLQNASWNDRDKKFWEIEEPHLVHTFTRDVESRFRDGSVQHVSVFAFAPQPLLIKLGTLLTDTVRCFFVFTSTSLMPSSLVGTEAKYEKRIRTKRPRFS